MNKKQLELQFLRDDIKRLLRVIRDGEHRRPINLITDELNDKVDELFYLIEGDTILMTPREEQLEYVKWCEDNNKKASNAKTLFTYMEENKKC